MCSASTTLPTRRRSNRASALCPTSRVTTRTSRSRTSSRPLRPFYPQWNEERFQAACLRVRADAAQEVQDAVARHQDSGSALAWRCRTALSSLSWTSRHPVSTPSSAASSWTSSRACLQDERISILYSTHITSDLERTADFVTFLQERAQVVFSRPKDEVVGNWGVVKGGHEILDDRGSRLFRGSPRA